MVEFECSLLVHTYANQRQAEPMVAALRTLPIQMQLLVSVDRVDSPDDLNAWVSAVFNGSRVNNHSVAGDAVLMTNDVHEMRDAVLVTNNLHEIRA